MELGEMRGLSKDAFHVGILIGLVVILIGTIIFVFGCGSVDQFIPGTCGIWWTAFGKPSVLILHGDDGLGEPELLGDIFKDPRHLGIRNVQIRHMKSLSLGNLRQYDLVIVDHARTMSTEKMNMLIEYMGGGGRLVWLGDAGAQTAEGDTLLQRWQRPGSDFNNYDANATFGPWVRRDGKDIIGLDEFIGVNYVGNFCDVKSCDNEFPFVGIPDLVEPDHDLVRGTKPGLALYGNFAIVRVSDRTAATTIANIDFGSVLISDDGRNYDNIFPFIVTAGLGERVTYYSIPPEMFTSDEMPNGEKYYSFVENMYYSAVE
ncbi:MAG: hypothetical protein ABID38_00790 [Candidatus Diapherotrites archaeon]